MRKNIHCFPRKAPYGPRIAEIRTPKSFLTMARRHCRADWSSALLMKEMITLQGPQSALIRAWRARPFFVAWQLPELRSDLRYTERTVLISFQLLLYFAVTDYCDHVELSLIWIYFKDLHEFYYLLIVERKKKMKVKENVKSHRFDGAQAVLEDRLTVITVSIITMRQYNTGPKAHQLSW